MACTKQPPDRYPHFNPRLSGQRGRHDRLVLGRAKLSAQAGGPQRARDPIASPCLGTPAKVLGDFS